MLSNRGLLLLQKCVHFFSQLKKPIKHTSSWKPPFFAVVQELQMICIHSFTQSSKSPGVECIFLNIANSLHSYIHDFSSGDICFVARLSQCKKQRIHLATGTLSWLWLTTPRWIPVIDAALSVQSPVQYFYSRHHQCSALHCLHVFLWEALCKKVDPHERPLQAVSYEH